MTHTSDNTIFDGNTTTKLPYNAPMLTLLIIDAHTAGGVGDLQETDGAGLFS